LQSAQSLRQEEIEAAMALLRGEIMQVPPMYSAKKVKGQKLYELARRGEEIERQPVKITISSFHPIEIDGQTLSMRDDGTADLFVHVVCSAGTYVRVLAEDLGTQLGVGAHLAALRRTRAGRFPIESAITLTELAELAKTTSIDDKVIPLDATIGHLPAIVLNENDVRRVTNGVQVEFDSDHADQQRLRLQNISGELLAVGIYDAARRIVHPDVVLGN
jgi:tRNA pseudouridine55 synthase